MLFHICYKFISLNYKYHLLLAFIVRLCLIQYGAIHDAVSSVPYTDVDYKVFTDAARHVLNSTSPYNRHTYRYTPFIAILLVPNLILHQCFGKILFSLMDLVVGLLILLIVNCNIKEYKKYVLREQNKVCKKKGQPKNATCNSEIKHLKETVAILSRNINRSDSQKENPYECTADEKVEIKSDFNITANGCMLIWLYNPMTIAIATRGNCDSIAGFFVLLVLFTIQCKKQYFLSGLLLGIAIHIRLYPVTYSLILYMYLSSFSFYNIPKTETSKRQLEHKMQLNNTDKIEPFNSEKYNTGQIKKKTKTIFKSEYFLYLLPNIDQIQLVVGCLVSLTIITGCFYSKYGYKFIYESYVYHLLRKDIRHNFSMYFYLQYLSADVKNVGIWHRALIVLPKIVLLVVFSVRYGFNRLALNFSILLQTFVMVAYNTVLTSQYYIWILAVFPLCLWQIQMSKRLVLLLLLIWTSAQLLWLLPAYLLEFKGQNTLYIFGFKVFLFFVQIW